MIVRRQEISGSDRMMAWISGIFCYVKFSLLLYFGPILAHVDEGWCNVSGNDLYDL
jgi:hypothetical protein